MKRIVTLVLALAMTSAIAINASAVETPADKINNYEDAISAGYDDYMEEVETCKTIETSVEGSNNYADLIPAGYDDYMEEIVTRGDNVPSANKVYDLSEDDYKGRLNYIRTGIYTNYCFYPSSSGRLTFRWEVRGVKPLDGSTPNWKVLVGIYDMSGKYILQTKSGDFHNDFGPYHEESVTLSGLAPDTKYCFFISVYDGACQILGDCWVSQ